jgi:hypothetical protein
MHPRVSALERAFQIARSGQVSTTDDIRKILKGERYEANDFFVGPSLSSQLKELIKTAQLQPGKSFKS